ncbi:hypothetical protein [Actinomadura chokoriensis]|uniref:Uncharacterized protein n=1 Tax=Actinomadura chokoriensis TaxID=454156 RepID=A0ABV4R8P3_9ACTN
MSDTGAEDGASSSAPSLTRPALGVAIAIIVVWLGLLLWLAVDTSASEVTWSRLLVVLGSVEAVAFAAVGALFGTAVQRQRIDDLQTRADAAEARAETHQEAALNGRVLAAAVRASRGAGEEGKTERLSTDGRPGRDALVALADRLFPE